MQEYKRDVFCGSNLHVQCIHKCSCWQAILQMRYKNSNRKCKLYLSIFPKNDINESLLDIMQNQNDATFVNPADLKVNYNFDPEHFTSLSTLPISSKEFYTNTNIKENECLAYYLELNLNSDDKEKYKSIREINSQFSLYNFDLVINVNFSFKLVSNT